MSQKLFETKDDKFNKLEIVIEYLCAVDKAQEAAFYHDKSQKIMQQLHQEFQDRNEQYLSWVKYFDIFASKKEDYPGKKEDSEGYVFKQWMEAVVTKIFTEDQAVNTIDWRIAKKLLSLPNIFSDENKLLALISKDNLLKAFKTDIERALDYMIWLQPTSLSKLQSKALKLYKDFSKRSLLKLF